MSIYNVMEEIVRNALHEHLGKLQLSCTCEHCLDDILALSLNRLPPKYIVNQDNNPLIRASYTADRQGQANILSAVAQSAEMVSKNRRCGN